MYLVWPVSPQHLPATADAWTARYLVRVAMHELTHALVFSEPLLYLFPGGGEHGSEVLVR